MNDALIIEGLRTPIGNIGGALSHVRADDLAAHAIASLIARVADTSPGFDPAQIADVILGCANQAGEDNRNVARMAALLAGLPVTVPGETVNRLCASGLNAVASAARAIKAGEGDLYVAGGVESMTRAPYAMSKGATPFARDVQLFDTSLGWRFVNPRMKQLHGTDSMGETAENVAAQYGVSRDDQDAFAVRSQQKAAAAQRAGRLAEEIAIVDNLSGKLTLVVYAEPGKPGAFQAARARLRELLARLRGLGAGRRLPAERALHALSAAVVQLAQGLVRVDTLQRLHKLNLLLVREGFERRYRP